LAGEGFPIDHSLTATLGEALDDVWEPSAASHAS
jgi:hypothetical protein